MKSITRTAPVRMSRNRSRAQASPAGNDESSSSPHPPAPTASGHGAHRPRVPRSTTPNQTAAGTASRPLRFDRPEQQPAYHRSSHSPRYAYEPLCLRLIADAHRRSRPKGAHHPNRMNGAHQSRHPLGPAATSFDRRTSERGQNVDRTSQQQGSGWCSPLPAMSGIRAPTGQTCLGADSGLRAGPCVVHSIRAARTPGGDHGQQVFSQRVVGNGAVGAPPASTARSRSLRRCWSRSAIGAAAWRPVRRGCC